MEGQHWFMLAIVAIGFYCLGRVWDAPARMFGLP
jgi:hypothetical protein